MKIIKYIFLLLLLVIIGGALYIATLNGDYQVEESQVINAPASLLYKTVNNYKTWEEWGPWMDDSDDMIMSYPENTTGVGAGYSWKSEKQGDGEMKTVATVPNKSLDQKIVFITPMGESKSDIYWRFEPVKEGGTKVVWGMKGKQNFMEKAFWATQDSTLSQSVKPMYKEGLEKLAANVQKQMDVYSINIDGVTEHGGGFYMYSTVATTMAAIPQKLGQMLPAVYQYMQSNNIPINGQPFTMYNNVDENNATAIISAALPTRDKVIVPKDGTILCGFMEKQKMVKTTLKGNYTNLKAAWTKAMQYIEDNQLEPMGTAAPLEIYANDPQAVPNPADWITEIYIPIK